MRRLLLDRALGAAYTPLSIGGDGKIYAENAGHLFALGQCSGGPLPPSRTARITPPPVRSRTTAWIPP